MPADAVPDLSGHFGPYGGRFVPEALVAAIDELTAAGSLQDFTSGDTQLDRELAQISSTSQVDSELAKLNRLSVEEQAEKILAEAVDMRARRRRVESAARIAAMTPRGIAQTDGVILLREDRDR